MTQESPKDLTRRMYGAPAAAKLLSRGNALALGAAATGLVQRAAHAVVPAYLSIQGAEACGKSALAQGLAATLPGVLYLDGPYLPDDARSDPVRAAAQLPLEGVRVLILDDVGEYVPTESLASAIWTRCESGGCSLVTVRRESDSDPFAGISPAGGSAMVDLSGGRLWTNLGEHGQLQHEWRRVWYGQVGHPDLVGESAQYVLSAAAARALFTLIEQATPRLSAFPASVLEQARLGDVACVQTVLHGVEGLASEDARQARRFLHLPTEVLSLLCEQFTPAIADRTSPLAGVPVA